MTKRRPRIKPGVTIDVTPTMDISTSDSGTRPPRRCHNAIRIGLAQVKELSISSIRSIIEKRKVMPYWSIPDFMLRSQVGPKEAEALALCGALDLFGMTRPEILWKTMAPYPGLTSQSSTSQSSTSQSSTSQSSTSQSSGSPPTLIEAEFTVPPIADYPMEEKLKREREILGITVTSHPIRAFAKVARLSGVIPAKRLCDMIGKEVRVIGWLVTAKRTRTKQGEYMKFLTLEDESDIFEAILFPKVYKKYGHHLGGYGPYIMLGKVESDGGLLTLNARELQRVGAHSQGAARPSLTWGIGKI